MNFCLGGKNKCNTAKKAEKCLRERRDSCNFVAEDIRSLSFQTISIISNPLIPRITLMLYSTIVTRNETGLNQIYEAAREFEEENVLEALVTCKFNMKKVEQTLNLVRMYQYRLNNESMDLVEFSEYFIQQYATDNNNCFRVAEKLTRLSGTTPEDRLAYSQMHKVFELIASMNAKESEGNDKNDSKTGNQNRNDEYRRQITDFIADNKISDSKAVSKAIGLKASRTRDYLKQLVDEGILEIEGEYKNRKYKIKK